MSLDDVLGDCTTDDVEVFFALEVDGDRDRPPVLDAEGFRNRSRHRDFPPGSVDPLIVDRWSPNDAPLIGTG